MQAKYSYDAFGNCSITNSTNTHLANYNPIRYRGYYFDDETGWYFLNARYYSPEWRRFISPDDTAYLDPETPNGLNLYCYCNNDPINYADPSGHEAVVVSIGMYFLWELTMTIMVLAIVAAFIASVAYIGKLYEEAKAKEEPEKIEKPKFEPSIVDIIFSKEPNITDNDVAVTTQLLTNWAFNMFRGTGASNIAAKMFDTEGWLELK